MTARVGGDGDNPVAVSRLLSTFVAPDLDSRGYPYVGAIRRAALLLLELPGDSPGGCAGCGEQLEQPATGRRRRWCGEACRSRARRR